MTADEIRARVIEALLAVAPEADPGSLHPDRPLRDQLDMDSFDFLRFAIGLHERLGIDIPELDYPKLATLDAIVAYAQTRPS
jgi:acyl carrier protein